MKKFTITATITTIYTITKTITSADKNQATALLLTKYPENGWKYSSVLKTTSR